MTRGPIPIPCGIGLFTNRFYPSVGGVQASTRLMAQELTRLRHKVTVVTRSPLEGWDELSEGYAVLRTHSMLEVARLAARSDLLFLRGGVSKFAAVPALLVGARINLFHEMAWYATKRQSWLRRAILSRAASHTAVSHAALATIGISPGTSTRVLYNPVSADLWGEDILSLDARPIDVLFVGRIVRSKGIWVLAEALEALNCPARVSIVGDGPERTALAERLARTDSIKVTFHGVQSGEPLRRFYSSARVAVVPSQVIEGMSMVVAEAMANGTPVVVSHQAPLCETSGHGGMSFKMDSPADLARALEIVLSNRAKWYELHRAALIERERFSLTTYRSALVDLLLNTVSADMLPSANKRAPTPPNGSRRQD